MSEAELNERIALGMLVAEYGEGSTPDMLPNIWAHMLHMASVARAAIRQAGCEIVPASLLKLVGDEAAASRPKGDA